MLYQQIISWPNAGRYHAVTAGSIATAVYILTASPSISWGDSPELVAAAYELGVPHPTGYPLYMLMGHTAIKVLPWGDPAYRMNLLSGLISGAAVAVMHRLARQMTGSIAAAYAAAFVLAWAPLFWSHATIAEVYPLSCLFTLGMLLQLMYWDDSGSYRRLCGAALMTGFNLAHHLSIGLMAPGAIVFALTSRHLKGQWRRLPQLLLLMLAPLVFYLYVPMRAWADPWINWGDGRTAQAALYHISGRFYKPSMFAASRATVAERIAELPSLTLEQLGPVGVFLAAAGVITLLWRPLFLIVRAVFLRRSPRPSPEFLAAAWLNWRLAWLLGTWGTLPLIWGLNYWVFDYQVFYIPTLLAICLLVALGAAGTASALTRALGWQADTAPAAVASGRVTLGLAALGTAWMVYPRWAANDLHRDWSALRYARAVCQVLPQRALVFGFGDYRWFPLFYAKRVEGLIPDALVFNLYETRRPQSYRLFARHRSNDFPVLPVRGYGAPGSLRSPYAFLESLVVANATRRPVCFLMDRSIVESGEIRQILSPYFHVQRSNLSIFEYYAFPPPLEDDRSARTPEVRSFEDGTRLLSFSAAYAEKDGVQWVRLKYRWVVTRKLPLERLEARVWLTDAQGRWEQESPGVPKMHNTHALGYGYLPSSAGPQMLTFAEEYWIFVQQDDAGKTYQVRLKLERDGLAMLTRDGQEVLTVGEIAIPPAPVPTLYPDTGK